VIFSGLHLLVRAWGAVLVTVRGRTAPQVLSEIETRVHEGAPRACPSRMTPMQHTLSRAAMPKRSRDGKVPRPAYRN